MTTAHAAVFCFPDLHASLVQGLSLVDDSKGHEDADDPGDGEGALQCPGALGLRYSNLRVGRAAPTELAY